MVNMIYWNIKRCKKSLFFSDCSVAYVPPSMSATKFQALPSSSSIGPRWLVPLDVLQPCRLTVRAQLWKFPLALPGAPTPMTLETSSRERGNYGWEKAGNFADKWQVPRHLKGSFTCRKSVTWDRQLYFPSEGRHAEDFFALKNLTASDGFEPVNSGSFTLVYLTTLSHTQRLWSVRRNMNLREWGCRQFIVCNNSGICLKGPNASTKLLTVSAALIWNLGQYMYDCSGAVGWRAALHTGKLRVQLPMVSLQFFIDIILPAALYGPGVDSASNRNEHQQYFLQCKAASA
jgi:hypothetical protein